MVLDYTSDPLVEGGEVLHFKRKATCEFLVKQEEASIVIVKASHNDIPKQTEFGIWNVDAWANGVFSWFFNSVVLNWHKKLRGKRQIEAASGGKAYHKPTFEEIIRNKAYERNANE